ncbi:hypothetical protein FSP39_004507 [Pinctada imbricata]|uniref:OTU domain-containing protein n=1 Tax=Pinctada imbricata TaxID=66713 RepID=A0AA88XMF9_PINIB|nr:hypothetical protein FSP39_004507 [Pinctada imbricata]
MADLDGEEGTPEEILHQKHRREKKELQAEIQKLKSNVSKGDKKKKKDVAKQIADLESELSSRHAKEVAELENQTTNAGSENQVAEKLENLTTEDTEQSNRDKRPSKAQKRRDKKAQKIKEREELIQEQEIENLSGARNVEFNRIKAILKEMNLQIHEIPSDGNCLYKAIAHQLNKSGTTSSNEDLRNLCAKYMTGKYYV